MEDLEIDTGKEIQKNLSKIKNITNSFKGKLDGHSQRHAPFSGSKPQYDGTINEIIAFDPEANPDVDNLFNNFYNKLRNLPNRDPPIQNDIEAFIREIEPHKNRIKEILSKKEKIVTNHILDIMIC